MLYGAGVLQVGDPLVSARTRVSPLIVNNHPMKPSFTLEFISRRSHFQRRLTGFQAVCLAAQIQIGTFTCDRALPSYGGTNVVQANIYRSHSPYVWEAMYLGLGL